MKKCKHCGKNHATDDHYKVVSKLSDKGFPTHDKAYKAAHTKANKMEKKKFGEKQFEKLEKFVKRASKHELIGKNTKSKKIEVEKKIPKKYRNEVAFHEKVENKQLLKGKK